MEGRPTSCQSPAFLRFVHLAWSPKEHIGHHKLRATMLHHADLLHWRNNDSQSLQRHWKSCKLRHYRNSLNLLLCKVIFAGLRDEFRVDKQFWSRHSDKVWASYTSTHKQATYSHLAQAFAALILVSLSTELSWAWYARIKSWRSASGIGEMYSSLCLTVRYNFEKNAASEVLPCFWEYMRSAVLVEEFEFAEWGVRSDWQ